MKSVRKSLIIVSVIIMAMFSGCGDLYQFNLTPVMKQTLNNQQKVDYKISDVSMSLLINGKYQPISIIQTQKTFVNFKKVLMNNLKIVTKYNANKKLLLDVVFIKKGNNFKKASNGKIRYIVKTLDYKILLDTIIDNNSILFFPPVFLIPTDKEKVSKNIYLFIKEYAKKLSKYKEKNKVDIQKPKKSNNYGR